MGGFYFGWDGGMLDSQVELLCNSLVSSAQRPAHKAGQALRLFESHTQHTGAVFPYKVQTTHKWVASTLAGMEGFEPPIMGPEPTALPLGYIPIY